MNNNWGVGLVFCWCDWAEGASCFAKNAIYCVWRCWRVWYKCPSSHAVHCVHGCRVTAPSSAAPEFLIKVEYIKLKVEGEGGPCDYKGRCDTRDGIAVRLARTHTATNSAFCSVMNGIIHLAYECTNVGDINIQTKTNSVSDNKISLPFNVGIVWPKFGESLTKISKTPYLLRRY